MIEIVVPLKRLAAAKTRLAPSLSAGDRRDLMREMLAHVLATAMEAGVGPVWLASSDPSAGALAEAAGCGVVSDHGLAWNEGLRAAVGDLASPKAVLFLAGDLPRLSAAEVRRLAGATERPGVVIGRAHDGGTNALGLNPPGAIAPCFGVAASAAAHAQRAAAAGITARVLDLPGVALDVDTAADAERAGIVPARQVR